MSRGLQRFHRMLALGVRQCQAALGTARGATHLEERRKDQLENYRTRQEEEERERRRHGGLGSFQVERTRALVESALHKSEERLVLHRQHEEVAREALAEARRREAAVGRLLERRDREERTARQQAEQSLLDELAQQRAGGIER